MNNIFYLDYNKLIEFEKFIFVYSMSKELNFNIKDFIIQRDDNAIIKSFEYNYSNNEHFFNSGFRVTFNKNGIMFFGNESGEEYEVFKKLCNNRNAVLDYYIDMLMMDNEYQDAFDYLVEHMNSIHFEKTVYKYYSSEAVENEERRIKNGTISFSATKNLNDPFELSEVVDDHINKINKDWLRVFSCVRSYKNLHVDPTNILMWAHYGDSFKGYCFEYDFCDIIRKIDNACFNDRTIVIRGDVIYSDKAIQNGIEPFNNTNFQRIINNVFNKNKIWKYEDEYRIAIINESFSLNTSNDKLKDEYFTLNNVNYLCVYTGYKCKIRDKNSFITNQFKKVIPNYKKYKLEIDDIDN